MYWDFLADRAYWLSFFERYQDRLIYGTDMVDDEGDVVFGSQDEIVRLVMSTLKDAKPFTVRGQGGTGLGLPDGILNRIMHNNFEKRNGLPHALNTSGLNAYGNWLLNRLPKQERARCEELLSRF